MTKGRVLPCPLCPGQSRWGCHSWVSLYLHPQIVSQTKVTKPLLLKNGKNAGKSTITVGKVTGTHRWAGHSTPLQGQPWCHPAPRAGPHLRERALWGWRGGILPLVSPLQIVAEEVSGTNDYVQLTFRAHKLDNKVGTPEFRPPSPLLGSLALGVRHPPFRPHQAQGPFPPVSPGPVQQV